METTYFRFDEVKVGTDAYERYLEGRYQVFCDELHRIDAAGLTSRAGDPIETDRYDAFSRHYVAIHKQTGTLAAFGRVILPSEIGLNVTPRYIIERPLPFADATEGRIGEISRMAIAPSYRRRHEDQGKPIQGDPASEMSHKPDGARRHQPELVLGMYREMYRLCAQVGIAYYMAAMDNRFSRLLNTLGFPFVPVGPINEGVTPSRRVYLMSIRGMEATLGERHPDTLRFMQD